MGTETVFKKCYNYAYQDILAHYRCPFIIIRPKKNSCASCCRPSLKKPASLKFLLDF